jgi:hypothetical protein
MGIQGAKIRLEMDRVRAKLKDAKVREAARHMETLNFYEDLAKIADELCAMANFVDQMPAILEARMAIIIAEAQKSFAREAANLGLDMRGPR